MGNVIAKYSTLQRQKEKLQAEIAALEKDERFRAELEFKNKLVSLMYEFDRTAADVWACLSLTAQIKLTQARLRSGVRES
ncbi:hypothetical protein [Modicisalibacter luteus]|uniref:Uncharacterized protein n=1 Tax=Modicisalibacter luteus TaxID=453962 RepID=A0ABV7M734_9GAMM|nr:hypothetical protein [Halomonas lutea]GHB15536.1 hypothetical protein GCM10007159_42250 [Halomonas lutea]